MHLRISARMSAHVSARISAPTCFLIRGGACNGNKNDKSTNLMFLSLSVFLYFPLKKGGLLHEVCKGSSQTKETKENLKEIKRKYKGNLRNLKEIYRQLKETQGNLKEILGI